MRFRYAAGVWIVAIACNQAPTVTPPPTKCTIDGAMVAKDAVNSANPCQSCQPTTLQTGWSSLPSGLACGDGGAVCLSGACVAGCFINGVFYSPDSPNPGTACQTCQPSSSTANWSGLSGTAGVGCVAGQVCLQGACHSGCLIQGTVYEPGQANPGVPCETCDPVRDSSSWSPSMDGQACGAAICFNGRCDTGCVIAGAFYTPGQLNPSNVCESCQPTATMTAFSALTGIPAGTGCPSGQVCSAGSCKSGCFISNVYSMPGARSPGNNALCCNPQSETSGWTAAFTGQSTYATGRGPLGIVHADFNGDSKEDLAVVNRSDGTVDVFLGVGDGTFTGPLVLTVGNGPVAIAAGDLNGDGRPDLVVANADDQTVSVLLNAGGTAGFLPQTTYGTKGFPSAVALGDLNGDRQLDLAVTNLDQATVAVLTNVGDGGFGPAKTLGVGNFPQSIVATDLNGDGLADLAIAAGNDNAINVLINQGQVFGIPFVYPVGANPVALGAADLNGDGRPDLIVANSFDNTVGVLLNQPDGGFAPQIAYGLGTSIYSFAIADLNGDSIPDLAIADYAGGQVGILLSQGNGSFAAPFFTSVGRPFSAYAVAAAKLGSSPSVDLAVIGLDNASLRIVINGCP